MNDDEEMDMKRWDSLESLYRFLDKYVMAFMIGFAIGGITGIIIHAHLTYTLWAW